MSSQRVEELTQIIRPDNTAEWVGQFWDSNNQQRSEAVSRWAEVDSYITATDTTQIANIDLPWTHNSVLPKTTQIRDNLHSNYLSALFPNDKWLTWLPSNRESAYKQKSEAILAYMDNKTREGGFTQVISRLLYDYIDRGNSFAMPSFETRYKPFKSERVVDFVGPKLVRISPNDIVFNPRTTDIDNTPKCIRTIYTIGELKRLAELEPDYAFFKDGLERRSEISKNSSRFTADDWSKAQQYQIDGFGNLQEYYQGNSVEVLEFIGDYHDSETGELFTDQLITVIDRSYVVRQAPNHIRVRHVGWRERPDNLWAMSPLENLIGLQYMIDHYLNMGANALDLKVMPPKKIIGEVEEFEWSPNSEIHIDENGDVQEMAQQFGDIYTVRDWIEYLENKMEMYAGAPREAMGIRTPGEKTAFEVQSLENAAGRIFQEKITQFEIFMESCLNDMLEISYKHMDKTDVIRIVDPNIGSHVFKNISKEDILADGILRPIGARHFAQKAQELQNLIGIFNSPLGQLITPHTSTVALTQFVEDVMDLRGYDMFRKNVAVFEQQELQQLMQQAQEDNQVKASGPSAEEMMRAASVDKGPDQTGGR